MSIFGLDRVKLHAVKCRLWTSRVELNHMLCFKLTPPSEKNLYCKLLIIVFNSCHFAGTFAVFYSASKLTLSCGLLGSETAGDISHSQIVTEVA